MNIPRACLLACLSCLSAVTVLAQTRTDLGLFQGTQDIGVNTMAGSASFDPASVVYTITGNGANIWAKADAFQFAWTKVAGDAMITADIALVGQGKNTHRKAVLMFRQSLAADAVYASAALHGDGLTSLQFREAMGGETGEARAEAKAPARLRLVKQGNRITLFTAQEEGGALQLASTATVNFTGSFYVGLGVCSHDVTVVETTKFKGVAVEHPPVLPTRSRLHIFDTRTGQSTLVHEEPGILEAPNWSRDGSYLLVNARGRLFKLPAQARGDATLQPLAVPESYRCNNDHDLSPDGKRIAFSASTAEVPRSQVFVANADGTDVRRVTEAAPSYFHGWSPDGKWLAFVGQRNRKFELYRVPAAGGPEERLTSAGAYDDGPEYSPDGKWIYFNSNRGGGWNIWRIPANGGGEGDRLAEQVTNDAGEDWFPHLTPDGKTMVLLSFPAGTIGHNGRMNGMMLRRMKTPGNKIGKNLDKVKLETLATFPGGQGTINVNSWSPDGKQFAYVQYVLPE